MWCWCLIDNLKKLLLDLNFTFDLITYERINDSMFIFFLLSCKNWFKHIFGFFQILLGNKSEVSFWSFITEMFRACFNIRRHKQKRILSIHVFAKTDLVYNMIPCSGCNDNYNPHQNFWQFTVFSCKFDSPKVKISNFAGNKD